VLEQPAAEEPCELALCLSGGGYRAMLFHLGALWRLNELGYLGKLDRVSSVSGGSIAAGVLAKHWDSLEFDSEGHSPRFQATVAADIHGLAGRTVDAPAILGGLFWFGSIGNRVAAAYRRHLFGSLRLSNLPDKPRFVFNATNLQTGSLFRFSKPYMADYKVGQVKRPELELATAVAASSAFPPVLSPVRLDLDEGAMVPFDDRTPPLHREPYTRKVVLSDGGVYDNLGLETALGRCDVLLVSDGGGRLKPAERPRRAWPLQTMRVLGVIDSQVRALRAIDLVDGFEARRERNQPGGALWTIRTPIGSYGVPDALPVPETRTDVLAATPTRLGKLPEERQQQLVNWGYAASDAALRRYMAPGPAPAYPYPATGVG
jgi:NTE family protein